MAPTASFTRAFFALFAALAFGCSSGGSDDPTDTNGSEEVTGSADEASTTAAFPPAGCRLGSHFEHLSAGKDDATYGQRYFHYKGGMSIKLQHHPRTDQQMYLYGAVAQMWVYGQDWCYQAVTNTIRVRKNATYYGVGGVRGGKLTPAGGHDAFGESIGDIIWIGYNPK